MQHDIKSAGGRFATDSATQSGPRPPKGGLRRRPSDELSFVVRWDGPRGGYVDIDYFEVPSGADDGHLTGARMAAEFFEYLRLADRRLETNSRCVLRAVAEVLATGKLFATGKPCDPDRRKWNAAWSFMSVCAEVLAEAALHGVARPFALRAIDQEERSEAFFAQKRAQDGAEFARRMRAAKLAKAAHLDEVGNGHA